MTLLKQIISLLSITNLKNIALIKLFQQMSKSGLLISIFSLLKSDSVVFYDAC